MGCFPSMKAINLQQGGAKCIKEATDLAKLHNIALSKALQELESQLEGFKYSNPNLYNLIEERMNNPSKYGILSPSLCDILFASNKLQPYLNSTYVLLLQRFQRREYSMLWFGSLQRNWEMWKKRNSKWLWVMWKCKRIRVLWFRSSYRQGLPADGWANLERNFRHHRTLQFESTIWLSLSWHFWWCCIFKCLINELNVYFSIL